MEDRGDSTDEPARPHTPRIPRIGILGGGGILAAHAPAFRRVTGRCVIAALAEPNPDRADAIRHMLCPDVAIVPDYRDLLSSPDIDAVDILLPHHLHMPATIEAAHAGKHVLVEKVMARNIDECDRMIRACEEAGVSLTVCHDRRYAPEWRAMKEIVDSGDLGRVFFWRLNHNQDVAVPPGHWIRSRDALGGGAIMSCLTHQIDALRWFDGEIESVACMTGTDPLRMEGEFLGVVTARMKTGALAELAINWWTTANRGDPHLWYEMAHACGTSGEAYMMSGRGVFVKIHDRGREEAARRYGDDVFDRFVPISTEDGTGHDHCIREWVAMLAGEPSRIVTSGRECRGTVEVAEAAYRAERQGRTVHLPIEPER